MSDTIVLDEPLDAFEDQALPATRVRGYWQSVFYRLRHDPVLKSVCDRTPQAAGLSSQPTLSRLENAVDGRTLRAVLVHLEEP